MPTANEITATIVTPLLFQSIFAPYRRSLSNVISYSYILSVL
jgi:hypothetical protein